MPNRRSHRPPPPPPAAKRLAVIGIGSSAGGLEAATRLVAALPGESGMAFILVQHLEPTHDSLMVALLSPHTAMTVRQAADGMAIEPNYLYVIPPGAYLAASDGVLHVSKPPARLRTRMPIDFLLRSLAAAYGEQAGAVILSGMGADGSAGALAIKAAGGLVLAQDPAEAGYDGMPRHAIDTGAVSLVLPVASIADALGRHVSAAIPVPPHRSSPPSEQEASQHTWMQQVVGRLRQRTAHDFSQYKPGTLHRRVERRMGLAGLKPTDWQGYLAMLQANNEECDALAGDLLINVTSFFRDPAVFDRLATETLPALVRGHAGEGALRVWVAGCSTGEETYSLAMMLMEQIAADRRPIKLQIFASDIDAEAIATARDGTYSEAALHGVTPDRLARFFSQEEAGWRASPELRATIVFTVHDLLTDPPFCRLDLVSCRNLLIYLRPDAQAQVIDVFHFALRPGGILLLGSAETVVQTEGRFDTVSKPERIYRRVGSPRTNGQHTGPGPRTATARDRTSPAPGRPIAHPAALAELGRRLVLEAYAPASALVNGANDILFSLGPTDRYLRLPPGHATHDLLAMVRPGLHAKLRTAMHSARETKTKVQASGRITTGRTSWPFILDVYPVPEAGEAMLLVCFVQPPVPDPPRAEASMATPSPRLAEVEGELAATQAELHATIRELELAGASQNAINEEALSVNEENQSANEELLASKEELQSLNEELTVLNSQLQETLERQRVTADDLQNVLYSTNVATLFLDLELRIKFFTPAIRSLFAVIPSDVGRKLTDFAPLAPDTGLEDEARTVLANLEPLEREIEAQGGTWFRRRILPYRAHGDRVEGVVITFTDITARKAAGAALEEAKRQADNANAAKSRFLAAASHDLRQPLQTLSLLQTLLAQAVDSERAKSLVARFDHTLGAMAGMLDTLLDINEIEAGVVHPERAAFAISELLDGLQGEFAYLAEAKGLTLRVVSCAAQVVSDKRMLEQMIRNLLSNALKYTATGGVLLGCRHSRGVLSVEVWDSGIGIPEAELETIFDEYHQIDNPARERSRGLGLGLSIVKRLGGLLHHPIRVRSRRGKGSGFSVEVPLAPAAHAVPGVVPAEVKSKTPASRAATILVVEDDPDLRDLLSQLLTAEGHAVTTAADGPAALRSLPDSTPELVIADYNLPNGPNGLELSMTLRRATGRHLPVIILTGDISVETLRDVARQDCAQLNKPVTLAELTGTIARLLAGGRPDPQSAQDPSRPVIFVVDDDDDVRSALGAILTEYGHATEYYASGEAFVTGYRPSDEACLLIDANLPGMSGIELIERMHDAGDRLPSIMITGQSDVKMAIRAMKAGASDFIEKPVGASALLASVSRALEESRDSTKRVAWQQHAATQLSGLTPRQHQIMDLVLAGQPSKNIAADLGISQRTVENHRSSIMHKTGSASLPALARLALAARSAAA